MTNVKRIETYSLHEFCQEVQAAIKDGFSFDFESNENFPQNYGTLLTCGLVKVSEKLNTEEVVTETEETVTQTEQTEEVVQNTEQTETEASDEQTDNSETQEPAKRGPKPKNK